MLPHLLEVVKRCLPKRLLCIVRGCRRSFRFAKGDRQPTNEMAHDSLGCSGKPMFLFQPVDYVGLVLVMRRSPHPFALAIRESRCSLQN